MTDPGPAQRARIEALQREIVDAGATLASLRADIAAAETQLHGTASYLLLEANEQLVLAMLKAQGEADTAAAALVAVHHLAGHDALTHLPNRSLLHDRWMQAAAGARRHGKKMAVLFIDLNDFKRINDTLGHAIGDAVLVATAARLTSVVREADTVGRYGGDEFVVLLAEITSAADAGVIARKLLAAMAEPLEVDGHAVEVAASIGIGIYPDDAEDVKVLLELADQAMYAAKHQGGGVHRFPSPPAATGGPQPPRGGHDMQQALGQQARLNELLREANEKLVVAAMDATELHENAERALERHRTYLALLGHEIRTPLSPLRYAAAMLGLGRLEDSAISRLRLTIERQVVQIARLVDDMMALSSASRARLDVERQPADVVALARQAAEDCRSSIEARQQQLTLTADPPVQQARVDPVRVVQIISNLIDNASKYTPGGGRISVTVTGTAHEVVLAVKDTGMGISVADARSLFEPFVRAPEAMVSGFSGLGIGLTVVRELVAAHQGSVDVHSPAPGQGTEFVVRLPREPRTGSLGAR